MEEFLLRRQQQQQKEKHGCAEGNAKGKGPAQGPVASDSRKVNRILYLPASGGGYAVRQARVIGLGELMYFFGDRYAAEELYLYWCHAQKLTLSRSSDPN